MGCVLELEAEAEKTGHTKAILTPYSTVTYSPTPVPGTTYSFLSIVPSSSWPAPLSSDFTSTLRP